MGEITFCKDPLWRIISFLCALFILTNIFFSFFSHFLTLIRVLIVTKAVLEWQKSPLEWLYLVFWANIKEFKADIREICTSGNMKKQQLHYIIFNRKEVQYIGMHYRKTQLITEKLSAGFIFSTLFQNQIFIILCE